MTISNEKIHPSLDALSERKSSCLAELVNPRSLPEAGFQSYESLKNNAADQKDDFVSDRIENPILDYPKMNDLSELDKGIGALGEAIETVDTFDLPDEYAEATKSSLEFRVVEMEYVKLLANIDSIAKGPFDEPRIRELTDRANELNEKLYGVPKPEIVVPALNEVFSNIDNKTLSPSAQKIYKELVDGFRWNDKYIAPLERPSNPSAELPSFQEDSLEWASEHILEKNAHIEALVRGFWDSKVEEFGDDYVCSPKDIHEAFETVLNFLDPTNDSGVRIILDPDASALSWESSEMAVKVGGKRKPIVSSGVLFEKVLHELGIHGRRSIEGLKTDLPVLGTGLFTETPRPDYLTFEEGLATTISEIVAGGKLKWTAPKLAHYINIYAASENRDFRSVFEISWRYSVLMGLKDGEDISPEMIAKQKGLSYNRCVRIFRGTQTNLGEKINIKPMTYNKDLAYLEGRVLAMEYIKKLYQTRDEAGLDRLFLAKYDPTNPVQDQLVKTVLDRQHTIDL